MSEFAVKVCEISDVWEHPNADKLALAKIKGMDYQFVIGKDENGSQFKVGDKVIYFPIDSILPEWIITDLGLTGKLDGKDKNRVRTVKLRKQISQGLVADMTLIHWHPTKDYLFEFGSIGIDVGTDLTSFLDITKYEEPEKFVRSGNQKGMSTKLPPFVTKYDIENAQAHPDVVDYLMNIPCLVMEKIEGSHFSASIYKDGKISVCSRSLQRFVEDPVSRFAHEIETLKKYGRRLNSWLVKKGLTWFKRFNRDTHDIGIENGWYQAYLKHNIKEYLTRLKTLYPANECITIRGELIGPGIQNNIYKLKQHELLFFEIEFNGIPLGGHAFLEVATQIGLPIVPIIRAGKTLKEHYEENGYTNFTEACTGKSVLLDSTLREGIVVRPMKEEKHELKFGRPIIKQRSPEYLAETGL